MSPDFHEIRLRDLRFFECLARVGSITAAARELDLPKATASRWLSQLEERVGTSLVRRTTRRISLTESGDEFARRCRDLLAAARAAQLAIKHEVPTGTLRVSVPVPMGRMLAGPVIARFRRRMPMVRLEIQLENERVDLIQEGVDLAIRGGPLDDSELLTRRLSSSSMWMYASTRYRNEPEAEIPLIGSPGDATLLRKAGSEAAARPDVVVDDRTAVADALAWGAGRGLLPSFLGEPRVSDNILVRLSPQPIVSLPIHAVYHHSQREDPRLLALVEEVERQLRDLL